MESSIADILYDYARTRLEQEQIRNIFNRQDFLQTVEDDDEEEIKEEIWNLVKHSLHWASLINMIRLLLDEEEEEDEDQNSVETDTE